MSKNKQRIKFICEKCGGENFPLKKESNKNWNVINSQCDKCGGKLKIIFTKLNKLKASK